MISLKFKKWTFQEVYLLEKECQYLGSFKYIRNFSPDTLVGTL